MTALFNRSAVVDLIKTEDNSLTRLRTETTVNVKDLRVKFRVEKNLGKEPNPCSLTIHNLSETTRAETINKPLHVRISAGYEDEGPKRIFTGDLMWSSSIKPKATWVTTMELGDGNRSYSFARTNRGFKKGVTIRTALKEVAKSMGLKAPDNISDSAFDKQFTSGLSLEGASRREMDRLTKLAGFGWSIQDGTLQMLKKGRSNPIEVITISQDTGMLGVPEFGPPAKKKDKPVLEVRTYLDGRFKPGNLILMQAARIRGLFVIQRVLHEGDTHGPEWYSSLEAIAK